MPSMLRNVLAVAAGIVLGAMVNGGLISLSPSVIPPPAGVDPTDAGSLRQSIHLFQPRHFIFPFLAHALGTLVGAYVAYRLAATKREQWAWAIGLVFLIGGVLAATMIPAPAWFIAADLLLAYLPMAWLAIRMARAGAGDPAGS